MSKMALRSSRSRSKTPFVSQDLIDNEIFTAGNHVEKTVVRTTRRTTVIKSNETASSSTDEVNTSRESDHQTKSTRRSLPRSEKSLRNRVIRTSDYSSEDGENEVSSTRVLRQNEKNQFVEQARTLVNGSEMPALELYKKSGRYWEVYPKTDWTYSQHSKDRVEIAPGVVAMPNMSRKTIRSLDESGQSYHSESSHSLFSENVAHKNINTDDLFTKYSGSVSESVKRNLFNNNADDYYIKRRSYSRWTSTKTTITRIFTSIFSVFYYFYLFQTTVFSLIHRVASKVMLWDTYLMWKSRPGDKVAKLVLLCLLPLLILSGTLFFSSLGSAVYGLLSNYSSTTSYIPFGIWDEKINVRRDNNDADIHIHGAVYPNMEINQELNSDLSSDLREKRNIEEIGQIHANNYPPLPTPSEIASSLTQEQLQTIALIVKNSLNLDSNGEINSGFVEKIIHNPSFHNMINSYYVENMQYLKTESDNNKDDSQSEVIKNHELIIKKLLQEIEDIKNDISLKSQLSSNQYAKLSLDVKKCCNKIPVVNVEGYVHKVVTDLLNNPEFLRNQKGLNDWLRSLFVAKQQLEYYVGNVTSNMDDKMASLIQANSQIIMDEVAAKLVEINAKRVSVKHSEVISDISEDEIKKVVRNVLAIYDADKTGLVDYAMESMGGQIVTTRCTELYHSGKAVVSILGVPLWYPSNSPRTIIRPSIAPGECWAFQNFPGFVVIKLSTKVTLEAFSMEHISRLLVPDGKIDSAPKQFEVYGLVKENDRNPILLGTYTYDYDGDPLQFFPVQSQGHVFDMVELRVISNHGNPNYTCLYRFRVHGQIYHEGGR